MNPAGVKQTRSEWNGGPVKITGPWDDGWELRYVNKYGQGIGICGYRTREAARDDRRFIFASRYDK